MGSTELRVLMAKALRSTRVPGVTRWFVILRNTPRPSTTTERIPVITERDLSSVS